MFGSRALLDEVALFQILRIEHLCSAIGSHNRAALFYLVLE